MAKKVWVVSDSEPIPQLTGNGRLMRAGMIAEYMAAEGADTIWWASTWLHWENRFYSDQPVTQKIGNNLTVKLLHAGKAYKKHISSQRILYCLRIAREFKKAIACEERPDVIICSWPLMSLGYLCVKYGKKHGVPVVLDIRDLWPDIFTQPFSGLTKKLVQLFINVVIEPYISFAFKNADQVIGVTRDAVDMAYKHGRSINTKDKLIPLCYKHIKYSADELKSENEFWKDKGLREEDFVVIFIGSIQLRIAKLDLVLDAAKQINDEKIKFVLCGGGTDVDVLKEKAEGLKNVIFPGYVNARQLYALGKRASVGLLPYANTPDFINALPNKFGEYLSYGLFVLTSLKGDSRTMLEENSCGKYYANELELMNLCEDLHRNPVKMSLNQSRAFALYEEMFNADVVYTKMCRQLLKGNIP